MALLYADENFPRPVVVELRRLGHDVLTCHEAGRGGIRVPDPDVLAAATALGRAVLTINRKDFRRLHRQGDGRHAGIVTCTEDRDVLGLARRISDAIRSAAELPGQLVSVVRPLTGAVPAEAVSDFYPNESAVYSPKEEGDRSMTNEPLPATSIPGAAPANSPSGVVQLPPTITIDDVVKVELRVGTVLEAAPAPKGDKLLVLQVDLGTEKRQILAGIRQHYTPEQMVGKQIIVVANLAPREFPSVKMTSQGMLLAAHDPTTGKVIVLSPSEPVSAGSKVS